MREHPLLLDHRLPDVVVAHHRNLEDGHRLEAEVVLPQDAELQALRHGHRAGAGPFLAGQDAEERRLPRTVGPDQAIAVAGVELNRHPFEQRLGSIGLAEVGYRDHRARDDNTRTAGDLSGGGSVLAGLALARPASPWAGGRRASPPPPRL